MRQTGKVGKFMRDAWTMRRCCEPSGFALSSVSGSSPRSLRQAPRAWARTSAARAPGSGSPVPAFAGRFQTSLASEIKNPPERLAREGPCCGLSTSFTRDRSHEPGVRHRSAYSRSIVGRGLGICGSSQGSCSLANLSVREGAGNTPAPCGCQARSREVLQSMAQSADARDVHHAGCDFVTTTCMPAEPLVCSLQR